MDLQRLMELEKLAGLRLDPAQREGLLGDLAQLEEFASRLPEISPGGTDGPPHRQQPAASPSALPMDLELADSNAPAKKNGFYEIPSAGGGSS